MGQTGQPEEKRISKADSEQDGELDGMTKAMVERPQSVFTFSAHLLNGSEIGLEAFRGHVLLIVNTASQCGFTPQYAELEALYCRYRERGFDVLGFPSNQFGKQEPGAADEIRTFCATRYGISFPLFDKIDVNGPKAHPLYRFLKREKSGLFGFLTGGRIPWNFTKFLTRRSGEVAGRYAPSTRPSTLAPVIEQLLDAS